MKCYICDSTMSSDEIKLKPKYGHGGIDPCGKCMEIINDIFEPMAEEDLDVILGDAEVDLLSNEEILT